MGRLGENFFLGETVAGFLAACCFAGVSAFLTAVFGLFVVCYFTGGAAPSGATAFFFASCVCVETIVSLY